MHTKSKSEDIRIFADYLALERLPYRASMVVSVIRQWVIYLSALYGDIGRSDLSNKLLAGYVHWFCHPLEALSIIQTGSSDGIYKLNA